MKKQPKRVRKKAAEDVVIDLDSEPEPEANKSKKQKAKKAADDSDRLDRAVTAVLHIRMPAKRIQDPRTRKTKVVQVEPLSSPLFSFKGTTTYTELLETLAGQAQTSVAALHISTLKWRFTVPKNGPPNPLANDVGFVHFQNALALAKLDKIVEFSMDPPAKEVPGQVRLIPQLSFLPC